VRHPDSGQTVAQVIHTFGRKDELDREALVRLCRSIARVCGLKVEDPRWASVQVSLYISAPFNTLITPLPPVDLT
jgi:hypothetical protein